MLNQVIAGCKRFPHGGSGLVRLLHVISVYVGLDWSGHVRPG